MPGPGWAPHRLAWCGKGFSGQRVLAPDSFQTPRCQSWSKRRFTLGSGPLPKLNVCLLEQRHELSLMKSWCHKKARDSPQTRKEWRGKWLGVRCQVAIRKGGLVQGREVLRGSSESSVLFSSPPRQVEASVPSTDWPWGGGMHKVTITAKHCNKSHAHSEKAQSPVSPAV